MTDYNKEEKRKAKIDNATLVKNSGRGERKGDARLPGLLIDYKFTAAKSYSLNIEQFKKHQKDAWKEQLEAVVVAVFSEYGNKSIAMIEWEVLKELLNIDGDKEV